MHQKMGYLGSLELPEEEITVIFFKEQKNDEKSQFTLTVNFEYCMVVFLYKKNQMVTIKGLVLC